MRVISNSFVMFKRCLLTSLRNPEAIGTAIFVPAIVMLLFGLIFGNVMDVGDYTYIDFIVPGIILQTVAQAVTSAAINVNNDMTKGIMDRFRSMDIAKSAVLTGHVLAAVVRNIIATAIVIGVAAAIGFRPQASFTDWLIIAGVLVLYMLAITWIAVICGLLAKTPESAGSMPFLLFVLPYVSSGFVPVETLPSGLKWFAERQPMTPIIDSLRSLMLNMPAGGTLTLALIWSAGIIIAAFTIAVQIYKRKLS
ncbi:MAG: ABC transporter permease [Defluviitaleaceae bacterium]|nr:ABC transporter permease [Defluviitaleaceae bacterium]MCL2835232.1 ABC transporter permease [Defluviitaleaceae bacterium]